MKISASSNALEGWPLFRGLSGEQIQVVFDTMVPQRVAVNGFILHQDEPSQALYLVLGGTVKATSCGTGGSQVALGLAGAGVVLGELSAVDQLCHSADVVAAETCQLLRISRADWDRHELAMPRLARNLAKLACQRARSDSRHIEILGMEDLPCRVAHQLLFMAPETGCDDTLPLHISHRVTQGDLAELVGGVRQRVNPILMGLRKEKLIEMHPHHRITILNPRALAARFAYHGPHAGRAPLTQK